MIMGSQMCVHHTNADPVGVHSYAHCTLVTLKTSKIVVSATAIATVTLSSYPYATETCLGILSFYQSQMCQMFPQAENIQNKTLQPLRTYFYIIILL